MLARILIAVLSLALLTLEASASEMCSFSEWAWNSEKGRAENYREVTMPRFELTNEQQHPSLPCSICREDQVEIKVRETSALICRVIAKDVEYALHIAADEGFKIKSLIGYRVGRTKGPLDANGLRTQYSHHSFGLAIDVNPDQNGLYDRCVEFGSHCRLRRGGEWIPGTPGAITPSTPLYREMRKAGLKWGGELSGRQKDFMHFSQSGD